MILAVEMDNQNRMWIGQQPFEFTQARNKYGSQSSISDYATKILQELMGGPFSIGKMARLGQYSKRDNSSAKLRFGRRDLPIQN